MGLTQKLGTIPLAIQTDSSNNVGIGGAANASYKLAVTGASLFSSSVYVGANISQLLPITTTNFQILTGCYYDGSNIIATATSGNRIINNSGNFQFNTFTGATVGASVSDTERMRITSSGNVGIGTSNPGANRLSVQNSACVVDITSTTSTSFNALEMRNGGGSFYFGQDSSTGSFYGGGAYAGCLYTSGAYPIVFFTNAAERMRITSGGQVQIKQSGNTFSDGLRLINTANNTWTTLAGGDNDYYFGYNGNAAAKINSAGTYTAFSDRNRKKDFEESNIGLDAILGLKPTLYRIKTDDENADKQLGFIAQEVKDFIPQAYSESINGDETFIGLNYNAIVTVLVKAIQEQQEIINQLSAKVTALENK